MITALPTHASLKKGIAATARAGRDDIRDLRAENAERRERMARLDGLLDGLREAVVGRTSRESA